jgi:hypothetical protein
MKNTGVRSGRGYKFGGELEGDVVTSGYTPPITSSPSTGGGGGGSVTKKKEENKQTAEVAMESVGIPIVAQVESAIVESTRRVAEATNMSVQETKRTNTLLAALLTKTAGARDIGSAVVGQGNRWNG